MDHTPFGDPKFLQRAPCEVVGEPSAADVLVTRWFKNLKPEIMALGKPVMVWTHEPFFTAEPLPIVRAHHGGEDVHIFSVWTKNVYLDNFYYAPRGRKLEPISSATVDRARLANRRTVMFAKHSNWRLKIMDRDVSLYPFRSELALALHDKGACDIHGKDWPDSVAIAESRGNGQRVSSKLEGLSAFPFTICCENSIADHYVTEKVWEAIEGGCLPMYYPAESLRVVFPENSFLDLSRPEFSTPELIYQAMLDMSEGEWIARMNACIKVFQSAVDTGARKESRRKTEEVIFQFLRDV
jgi:hypothetical protein